ncbi:MAG: ATP-binding protein [Gammaproteobacteria bacterium]
MDFTKIKPPISVSVFVLFGMILLSLHLMSSATQESSQLSQMYSWLVLVNALGSVILLSLVGVNIYSLMRQLKKREAGSRLTTRMVMLFVLLSLAPASIVFYYSVQFLQRSIDSWFNVEIDRALEDALELSQASLEQRMRWHLKQTQQMAAILEGKSETLIAIDLERLRDSSDAVELTLMTRQGRIVASSSINPSEILPRFPNTHVLLQMRHGKDYVGLDTMQENEMIVQAVVLVDSEKPQYLQAIFPVPVRISDLADSIEFAFIRYQEMTYLRDSLKLSFSLTLSLVLLLSLLAAIWIAFVSIRDIIAPVRQLVKGTQAVAAGHYEQQLPVMAQDDLGFLVESFNDMSIRIAKARDEAHASSLEVENQRAYLETILTSLTSGVISFDASFRIRTANQAADNILHVQVNRFAGRTLFDMVQEHADLAGLVGVIQKKMEQSQVSWQQKIAFLGRNGHQELLCRGAPLFSAEESRIGAVVVFDDVTDLIQAQKNAAWGEVARRLAHEIKNPLTPIQLSAERLEHKLSASLDGQLKAVLNRSTRTIVQQVEAMKKMVDDFSEYAKPTKNQTENIDLPELIREVLALYVLQPGLEIKTRFIDTLPTIKADPVRMRQVLHNLIKNALEAMDSKGVISIATRKSVKNNAEFIEIAVYDNGPGVTAEQAGKIFEPYVTNKAKGTGLGLAIVKKIVEEYGGSIWLDAAYRDGAGFIIQLPVA